ncbi:MAG: glycosyltransferase [Streptosporangiaceae bacterium]
MTSAPVTALFVVPSAKRAGGGDIWLDTLLAVIGDHGVQASVAFEKDGELVRRAQFYGCDVTVLDDGSRVPGGGLEDLVAPLAELIAFRKPQVSVFWSPRAQVYGTAAHRTAGRPGRIAWVQHVLPSGFWLHQAASDAPSDRVICVSQAVRVRQEQLYPASRAVVIHPGVNAPRNSMSKSTARKALGLDAHAALVGVIGRIEPWKGQDIAVRMLAEPPSVAYSLALIGERHSATWPDFTGDVEALARDLGVADRVTFTGHVADSPSVLSALDVLVCASREEGFSLAVLEAMAAGIPVVATRCGGPEDMIEHEVTGLLVPPENPSALANAISRVLRDRTLSSQLAGRARALHAQRFTSRQAAARFADALAELAADPGENSR